MGDALMRFQFLEEALKEYILASYKFADAMCEERVRFRLTPEQLDRFTLGRLLEYFARHSKDDKLIADAKRMRKHRNRFVHEAYHIVSKNIDNYTLDWDSLCKEAERVSFDCTMLYSLIQTQTGLLESWIPRTRTYP